MTDAISFSLLENDNRVVESDDWGFYGLQPAFVKWLSDFVGPVKDKCSNSEIYGEHWDFLVISTTGITDLNLTFSHAKDAAMFKLVYGYTDYNVV